MSRGSDFGRLDVEVLAQRDLELPEFLGDERVLLREARHALDLGQQRYLLKIELDERFDIVRCLSRENDLSNGRVEDFDER